MKGIRQMKQYLIRTWKNKLLALLLLALGLVPIWLDGDATILVVMLVTAIPLLVANSDLTK